MIIADTAGKDEGRKKESQITQRTLLLSTSPVPGTASAPAPWSKLLRAGEKVKAIRISALSGRSASSFERPNCAATEHGHDLREHPVAP
jgi:hypothetical protein